jgi:hypothetical protein
MKRIILAATVVFLSFSVFGWGPTGHRTTGYIATLHLNKKAKQELERILQGQSLAIASTWMDEIRSDSSYNYMADWHYVTIPDGMTYEHSQKNPNGDILVTIERIIHELKQKTVHGQKEKEYVKMLIHLIGDLHMPLHVGRENDRGGNQIKVMWFKTESNLHRVWDEDMINETRLSFTELAESLEKPTAEQLESWRNGTVRVWGMENLSYRNQIYGYVGNKLGYEYSYKNFPLIRTRLLQAGVRLAQVLNEIYGK